MQNLKILNKKEANQLLDKIKEQYSIKDLKLDYVFLRNNKNRIFITNRDISRIDLNNLKINSIGLYFCSIEKGGIRLTIEGSQLIGKKAKENVLELDDKEANDWLKGNDINTNQKLNGFVLIKNKNDFLGSGKYKEGKILNFVPKSRRLKTTESF